MNHQARIGSRSSASGSGVSSLWPGTAGRCCRRAWLPKMSDQSRNLMWNQRHPFLHCRLPSPKTSRVGLALATLGCATSRRVRQAVPLHSPTSGLGGCCRRAWLPKNERPKPESHVEPTTSIFALPSTIPNDSRGRACPTHLGLRQEPQGTASRTPTFPYIGLGRCSKRQIGTSCENSSEGTPKGFTGLLDFVGCRPQPLWSSRCDLCLR